MITSSTRAEEIKRQTKAERNVARELLLNKERKIDTSVKKDNFEENDKLVINGRIFTNTHEKDKKNRLRNTIRSKTRLPREKNKINKSPYVPIYKKS